MVCGSIFAQFAVGGGGCLDIQVFCNGNASATSNRPVGTYCRDIAAVDRNIVIGLDTVNILHFRFSYNVAAVDDDISENTNNACMVGCNCNGSSIYGKVSICVKAIAFGSTDKFTITVDGEVTILNTNYIGFLRRLSQGIGAHQLQGQIMPCEDGCVITVFTTV